MKCKYCDNEANVFYTQIIDGKSKKMSLCETCAEKKGISSLDEFKIADIVMSEDLPQAPIAQNALENTSECSHCGFTLDDLRKVGRLGCSLCYNHFEGDIHLIVKKMHRGTEHKGKMPIGMIAAMKNRRKLRDLNQSLDEAISTEDYEKAAAIRDELSTLNKKGDIIS